MSDFTHLDIDKVRMQEEFSRKVREEKAAARKRLFTCRWCKTETVRSMRGGERVCKECGRVQ